MLTLTDSITLIACIAIVMGPLYIIVVFTCSKINKYENTAGKIIINYSTSMLTPRHKKHHIKAINDVILQLVSIRGGDTAHAREKLKGKQSAIEKIADALGEKNLIKGIDAIVDCLRVS